MKNKVYFYLFIAISLIVIIFVYSNKTNLFQKNYLSIDSILRNNTWQTDFWKDIPYKKWDEIEYIFTLKTNNPKDVLVNLNKIKGFIDIKKIYLDDSIIDEDKLRKIRIIDIAQVKVIWEVKNINQDKNDIVEVIVVENHEKENIEPETLKKDKPGNISLKNNSFNSNINNLLELRWDNLDSVSFVNIWGKNLRSVFDSDKLYVPIDKNTFSWWDYFIFLWLNDWNIFTLNDKIKFTFSPEKINISDINPKVVKNDSDKYITIQWNWFNKIISIELSNNLILKSTSFTIFNDNVMWVKIPKSLPAWEYFLNIMDTKKIYELKNMKFKIN